MKKLKGAKKVHPSPSPLSFLPTALLALASALSAEEQEVLAYLLGSERPHNDNNSKKQQKKKPSSSSSSKQQMVIDNHPPDLGCSCFGCYKSFWARWDASPNRHVIHLIIDAFEEREEAINPKKPRGKSSSGSSGRKRRSSRKRDGDGDGDGDDVTANTDREVMTSVDDDHQKTDDANGHDDGYDDDDDEVVEEGKSSVSRFVSWVFGISN